jgi:hypothetical protein
LLLLIGGAGQVSAERCEERTTNWYCAYMMASKTENWIDKATLTFGDLQRHTGCAAGYLNSLLQRKQFVPVLGRRPGQGKHEIGYCLRDVAHVLLIRDALQCSVHLWRGNINRKNDQVLAQMLRALDDLIDQFVASGEVPQVRPYIIQRPGSACRTVTLFDLTMLLWKLVEVSKTVQSK